MVAVDMLGSLSLAVLCNCFLRLQLFDLLPVEQRKESKEPTKGLRVKQKSIESMGEQTNPSPRPGRSGFLLCTTSLLLKGPQEFGKFDLTGPGVPKFKNASARRPFWNGSH